MKAAIDGVGHDLIRIAFEARALKVGSYDQHSVVCPSCGADDACLGVARWRRCTIAAITCACPAGRRATVDAPGAVGSEP